MPSSLSKLELICEQIQGVSMLIQSLTGFQRADNNFALYALKYAIIHKVA